MMNTTTRAHISDADIKENVLSELRFEPSVKTSDIGVLVHDGTVTLNGFATSSWEKHHAVKAAKRVAGVNGIADDIKIKLPGSLTRTDGDIASSATQQIKWTSAVPADAIQVSVRDGWITLEGDVEWWYQKNEAEKCVRFLAGVNGVYNEIAIKPKLSNKTIKDEIEAAFKRSAMLDSNEVVVTTSGSDVVLRGKVRTQAEKYEAGRVAWAAAGVRSVDNNLTVNWSWLRD